MNPATRKASSGVGKILLTFGVVGVVILAFIFIAKKFNPLKIFGKLFGGIGKGLGGFFGGIIDGIKDLFGFVKPQLPKELTQIQKQDKKRYQRGIADTGIRREFRRYAKMVVRALEKLKNDQGIPTNMAGRISIVQSAFRMIDKTFVRNIEEQFNIAFDRKRELLRGNLVSGFETAAVFKKFGRAGGYATKIALLELREKLGAIQ